jgi:hypothetical protein
MAAGISFVLILAGVLLLFGAGFSLTSPSGKVRLEWLGWACVVAGAALVPAFVALVAGR